MTIQFSWGTGHMTVDAVALIKNMSLQKYRQWSKLFVQYGKPEDHTVFLQLLDEHIAYSEKEYHSRLAEHKRWVHLCDHSEETTYTQASYRNMRRLSKGDLNDATTRLNRCRKMRDILKGLLS